MARNPRQRLADAETVAYAVNRAPSTIRTWAAAGLITRRGTGPHGTALYDLDEAEKTAAKIDAPEECEHLHMTGQPHDSTPE